MMRVTKEQKPIRATSHAVHLDTEDTKWGPPEQISVHWIFNRLGRPSLGLGLFLIGLQILFFWPLAFPHVDVGNAPLGTLRYRYLGYILLSAGGLMELQTTRHQVIRYKPLWTFLLVMAIAVMTLGSWIDGEPILNIFSKTVPFHWLLLLPAIGSRHRNWPWIWLTFVFHALVGTSITLRNFFVLGATSLSALEDLGLAGFSALYMNAFLLLMLPITRDRSLWMITLTGTALVLLSALFRYRRATWFYAAVWFFLIIYANARSRGWGTALGRVLVSTFLVLLVCVPLVQLLADLGVAQALTPALRRSYSRLMDRLLQHGTLLDTVLQDSRVRETEALIAHMQGTDWLIGKGLAARWSSPYFREGELRYMVHNSWLNAFFWGGLPLFMAVTIPLVWTLRVVQRARNVTAVCFAAVLVSVYVRFPIHDIITPTPQWVVFCICLGAVITYDQRVDPSRPREQLTSAVRRQHKVPLRHHPVAAAEIPED